VRALYVDSQDVLWIGTYDGGLGRYDGARFTRITTKDGLFSNGVFQILEDRNGYLWMSSNQGIYRALKRDVNDFAAGICTQASPVGSQCHTSTPNGP